MRVLTERARRLASSRPDRAAVTSLFIDVAELTSAVADTLFPERDGLSPVTEALDGATTAAARAVVACWRGTDPGGAALELSSALARIDPVALPPGAERRVSEGYAYYALHPETYALAAERFARAVHPIGAAVVGIRTIGAGLGAVVVAALQGQGIPACAWSVRPHGHPFDRRVAIAEDLAAALRGQPPGTHFVVVDEGPGISGTSFASAAEALEALDVPAERIHLFPSWTPDPSSLQSPRARAAWTRYRKWHADAKDAGVGVTRFSEGCVDWSAGAWRQHLYPSEAVWPAAMAAHERVKAYRPLDRAVFRYAGLGRYGEGRRARAEALADGGLGVRPGGLLDGYLSLPFEPGQPCTAEDAGPELVGRIAAHIAYVSRAFPATRSPALDEVQHMIETNAREADPSLVVPALSVWGTALEDAPAAAIDGRMLPHEWIRTRTGFLKTDALDHSADHFFPGTQDPAWDLAAAEGEFDLNQGAAETLVADYVRSSGDREISRRLPFYRAAYAAFALGYADFAAQSLRGSPDAARFVARRARFVERLRAALGRAAAVSSQ